MEVTGSFSPGFPSEPLTKLHLNTQNYRPVTVPSGHVTKHLTEMTEEETDLLWLGVSELLTHNPWICWSQVHSEAEHCGSGNILRSYSPWGQVAKKGILTLVGFLF